MSKETREVYNRHWRDRVRPAILERDGHICQIRGPKCLVRATEVDHIVSWRKGGSYYDDRNLRAACKPCNAGHRSHEIRPSREW